MRNSSSMRETDQDREGMVRWHDVLAVVLFVVMAILLWSSTNG